MLHLPPFISPLGLCPMSSIQIIQIIQIDTKAAPQIMGSS